MKASQFYDPARNLKIQRANAIRQIARLNYLYQQHPDADCDSVLAQRESLYNKVKYVNSVLNQMKGDDANIYQQECLLNPPLPVGSIRKSKSSFIGINATQQSLGVQGESKLRHR